MTCLVVIDDNRKARCVLADLDRAIRAIVKEWFGWNHDVTVDPRPWGIFETANVGWKRPPIGAA